MSLTCSGENGCLFFKVNGFTNITNGLYYMKLIIATFQHYSPSLLTAKFGGTVSETIIIGHHTMNEKTTRRISTFVTSTSAPSSNNSLLDYATYATPAVAGFLILLFVIALVGTILFFYRTKDKKRYII